MNSLIWENILDSMSMPVLPQLWIRRPGIFIAALWISGKKKILKVISTTISSHRNLKTAMKRTLNSRETDGDWINFKNPGTDLSIPMIQTGFWRWRLSCILWL